MSRDELIRDALELLWGEFRHDTLGAGYYTDYQPLQDGDHDRVRWELEDAAERYLRGELSSIREEPVYPAEVVREAARKYAAGELASYAAEAESPVYQVDSNPA
jgi:hypothetical protein